MNQENQIQDRELTPWEAWIIKSDMTKPESDAMLFDKLCDLAVQNYDLDSFSRESDLKDRLHFFIEWWDKNREKSAKYRRNTYMDRLLKKKHGSVHHYLTQRTKTIDYDINTECIKDFLES